MTPLNEQDLSPTSQPDGGSLPVAAPPPEPVAAPKKHSYVAEGFKSRTKGEALFNFTSYVGVGYLGVTGVSVLMTWLLRDHKGIAPKFEKFVQGVVNLTKGHKTGAAFEAHAKNVSSLTNIATLFLGGTLMSVLPVKWLEDNKAKLVKGFDHSFYGYDKAEKDPTIVAAHADLEAAPKQTWLSVAGARLLAFALTFGTAALIGGNESVLGKLTSKRNTKDVLSLDHTAIKVGRWVDGAIHHKDPAALKTIERARHASPVEMTRDAKAPDRMFTRIANYFTLDGLYTVLTASSLFVFTRVLAPVFDQHIRDRQREEKLAEFVPVTQQQQPATSPVAVAPQARISHAEIAGRMETPQAELTV